jgi:hypothetical protein
MINTLITGNIIRKDLLMACKLLDNLWLKVLFGVVSENYGNKGL